MVLCGVAVPQCFGANGLLLCHVGKMACAGEQVPALRIASPVILKGVYLLSRFTCLSICLSDHLCAMLT